MVKTGSYATIKLLCFRGTHATDLTAYGSLGSRASSQGQPAADSFEEGEGGGLWDGRMTVAELDTKGRGRAKQWSNRAGLPRFFRARNPVPNSVTLSSRGLTFGTRRRSRFRDRVSDRPSPISPWMGVAWGSFGEEAMGHWGRQGRASAWPTQGGQFGNPFI